MSILSLLRAAGRDTKAVLKHIETPALEVAAVAVEALPVALPASAPVAMAVASMMHKSVTLEGQNVNQLEAFAITMIIGIIQSTVKNPAHKVALESQLVGVADMIFASYGMVAPIAAPSGQGQ